MIARVIFGLRRYVHSPLIVKGYSVNRLPVFLSPLSPPPHPSPSRGEGKVGVGLFATGTAPSSSPLPSPPPHGPLHWESNGHPGGEGGDDPVDALADVELGVVEVGAVGEIDRDQRGPLLGGGLDPGHSRKRRDRHDLSVGRAALDVGDVEERPHHRDPGA